MAELSAEKPKIFVRITRNEYTGKDAVTYVDRNGHTKQSALKNQAMSQGSKLMHEKPLTESELNGIKQMTLGAAEELVQKPLALVPGQREQIYRANFPVIINTHIHKIGQRESQERMFERAANHIIIMHKTDEGALDYCDKMIETQPGDSYLKIKDMIEDQFEKRA